MSRSSSLAEVQRREAGEPRGRGRLAGGSLEAVDTLGVAPGSWQRRSLRAFRVRGSTLAQDGIRDGDHLLVEERDALRDDETILLELDGRAAIKRCRLLPDGMVRLDAAQGDWLLPSIVAKEEIVLWGAVVGILRRRFGRARDGERPRERAARAGEQPPPAAISSNRQCSRMRTLSARLRALRATYASVGNARLRDALRDEARRIQREMQALERS